MPKDKQPPIDKTKKVSDMVGDIGGNELFEEAIGLLGIEPNMGRVLLNGLLTRAGKTAAQTTPGDLRELMPEIGRRLETVLKPNYASAAVERLRRFVAQ